MHNQTYYTVRFNDCDPFGHLNNSKYIDYMLNAREDHLSQFHNIELGDFHKQGFGWVVTNHEIQYIRPAAYNEKVCIQSDLIEAGDSHFSKNNPLDKVHLREYENREKRNSST